MPQILAAVEATLRAPVVIPGRKHEIRYCQFREGIAFSALVSPQSSSVNCQRTIRFSADQEVCLFQTERMAGGWQSVVNTYFTFPSYYGHCRQSF